MSARELSTFLLSSTATAALLIDRQALFIATSLYTLCCFSLYLSLLIPIRRPYVLRNVAEHLLETAAQDAEGLHSASGVRQETHQPSHPATRPHHRR